MVSMGVRFRWKLPALWTVSEELGRRVCHAGVWSCSVGPCALGRHQGGTGVNGPTGLFVLVGVWLEESVSLKVFESEMTLSLQHSGGGVGTVGRAVFPGPCYM